MFILLRVVAYYVKCFNMLFLFNQGPYWKQVLLYALYMLSFNKTIPIPNYVGGVTPIGGAAEDCNL